MHFLQIPVIHSYSKIKSKKEKKGKKSMYLEYLRENKQKEKNKITHNASTQDKNPYNKVSCFLCVYTRIFNSSD